MGGAEEVDLSDPTPTKELTTATVKMFEDVKQRADPVPEIHIEVPTRENYPVHMRYVAFWAKTKMDVRDIAMRSQCTAMADKELDDDDLLVFSQILIGDGVMKHIEALSLSGNAISDEGAKHIATAISAGALPMLRELYLGRNEIGDAGVEALLPALATLPLFRLNLGYNLITDVGGVTMAAALRVFIGASPFDQLRELWLNGNRISDAGVRAIAGALELGAISSIEELMLTSNPCSAKTFLLFQQQIDGRIAKVTPEADLAELAKVFHNE